MKAFHYWALAAAEADLFFCLTEEWWRSVRFQNSLASQCLAAPREVEVERTFLSQSNTGIQLFREVWKTQMMNGTLGMTFPFNSVLERVNQVFLKYSTQNISSYFGFGGFQAQGLLAFCMEIQNKEGTELLKNHAQSQSLIYSLSPLLTDQSALQQKKLIWTLMTSGADRRPASYSRTLRPWRDRTRNLQITTSWDTSRQAVVNHWST